MKYIKKGIAFAIAGISAHSFHAAAEEYSLISNSSVIGQNYGYVDQTGNGDETPIGEVDLVIETLVFFKNLELIDLGKIEGETFFGALVPIRARYKPSDNISIELGLILGQNFGDNDSIDEIEPIIRIVAEPTNDVYIIGGTLIPTHWIHDALLDDTTKLRDLTEQGLQLRIDKSNFKQDIWINWRIREGKIDAEELEIGNTSQLRLANNMVHLDAQMLWAHAGGQISTSRRVDNNFVVRVGGSVGVSELGGFKWIEDFRLGAHAFYTAFSTKDTDFETGNGYEIRATADLKLSRNNKLRLHSSYFDGNDFINKRGDPLYGLGKYRQVGATSVWSVGDGLQIEVGGVAQHASDKLNWSALINLSWKGTFDFKAIRRRRN